MNDHLVMLMWLMSFVRQKVNSVKCAECDYLPHTSISGIRTCPENCYGHICFTVVSNHNNGTLRAGCVNVDNETRTFFRDQAYCYREGQYSICGCTKLNRCNSPQSPLSMFTFINRTFFEDCHLVPTDADRGCNSSSDNITSTEQSPLTELSLNSLHEKDVKNNTADNESAENIHIGDRSSLVVMSTKSEPMVNASMIGVKSSSEKDRRNKTSAEFVDEMVRSLLPSINAQSFMDPRFSYWKNKGRVMIRHDGNSSGSQYGISNIIFSLLFFCCLISTIT